MLTTQGRNMLWRRGVSWCAVLGAAAVLAGALPAARGDLDSTFGSGGKVTTDFGRSEFARAVAVQRDGRVVVAGQREVCCRLEGPYDFLLARYMVNGDLDPSFDGDGKVATDFGGGGYDGATDVEVQGDGKIVAAGFGGGDPPDFALARYRADGSLDPTFGEGGKVRTTFLEPKGDFPDPHPILLQADGKIVAGGGTQTGAFALARYLPDGALDPSFGSGGRVITPTPRDLARVFALALQPDRKLVAAGGSFGGGAIVLARYNQDGSLDPTFGDAGIAVTSFDRFMEPSHLLVQRDGKLLVPGHQGITRFTADGRLDRSFGEGGRAQGSCCQDAMAAAIQPDGRIILIGSTFSHITGGDFSVNWLTANGSFDNDYAFGEVSTDFSSGSNDLAFDGALLPNGKLVAAGLTNPEGRQADFALARYVAIVFCVVPNVRGKKLKVAKAKLARARCRLGAVKRAYSPRVREGRVISQRPAPRARLPELARIDLLISRGLRARGTVP